VSALSQFAVRHLPAPVVRRLRRAYRKVAFPNGYFRNIALSDREIQTRAYETYLYGSGEAWRGHGAFQLFFLKAMGLQPSHTLLDIGCGPLRGGIHLIGYLDRGRYCGVDFNESFIRAAKQRIETEGLTGKEPLLDVIDDFALERAAGEFDFALAFSVLNHCDPQQRRRFLARVPDRLKADARLYVTHADWFDDRWLTGTRLILRRAFSDAADVEADLRMEDWGWPQKRPPVFPILELQRA
jgi:2-polyprenyl-3-methyl-5-hydroxy-6-metoxy-1,4-benzoquinol methylase